MADAEKYNPALLRKSVNKYRLSPAQISTVNYFAQLRILEAMNHERIMATGLQLGLSEDETKEVIAAWYEFHASRYDELSWPLVHWSMELRAAGEPWRPDDPKAQFNSYCR